MTVAFAAVASDKVKFLQRPFSFPNFSHPFGLWKGGRGKGFFFLFLFPAFISYMLVEFRVD